MPRARRAALLGGGVSAYVDLNFAAAKFKAGTSSAGDLTALSGFTFTRASLAMGYDATGKLVYGPNNLLLQSQTFGTAWTATNASVSSNTVAAPDGTLTADTLIEAAGAGQKYITQNVSGLGGVSGRVLSVYAKYAGRQYLAMYASGGSQAWFDLQGGTVSNASAIASITAVGNGWYRCTISKDVWSGSSDTYELHTASVAGSFTYTGDGTSGIYLWGAQLEAVTYQTTPSTYYPTTTAAYYGPRLVYDPVTLASQGILVEEARTNLCLQSQTFDNASWSKNGTSPVSVTSNSAIAPDGTLTADTLTGDNANADRVQQTIATTASAPYNFSVYLKNVNATASALTTTGTAPLQITVTWTGSDITGIAQTNGTGTYRSVGNGWWRVDGQFTLGGADTSIVFRIYPSYAGSGAKSVYAWQAQVE